jgi:hypothetical protein
VHMMISVTITPPHSSFLTFPHSSSFFPCISYVTCSKCRLEVVGMYFSSHTSTVGQNVCCRCYSAINKARESQQSLARPQQQQQQQQEGLPLDKVLPQNMVRRYGCHKRTRSHHYSDHNDHHQYHSGTAPPVSSTAIVSSTAAWSDHASDFISTRGSFSSLDEDVAASGVMQLEGAAAGRGIGGRSSLVIQP